MITDRNHKNQTVMEEKDSRMVILADTLSAITAATIATYTAKKTWLSISDSEQINHQKKRVQGKLIRQTEKQIKKKNNDAMILFIGFIYKTLK